MKITRPELNGGRYSIIYAKYYCGLLTEAQRDMYCQNVVNVILPASGLGSARVNHNAELCIVGLY